MRFIKAVLLASIFIFSQQIANCQDAMALVKQVKARLDKVNDYTATGKMKTDVAFLKVPVAAVNIYFKKPNKFRISKTKGISIMPKGGISVSMQNVLIDNDFVALDAGNSNISGTAVKVVKLLPINESSDVVLTTLYIDPTTFLIRKATTTTRESGTYDVEMSYGKFAEYALPDKMVFSFNTKAYRLPKSITLEFDDGERPDAGKFKDKKGRVEITYQTYEINKGVQDGIFK